MDNRTVSLALPLLLALSAFALISGNGFTGRIAGSEMVKMEAQIRLNASGTGVIPPGSVVSVAIFGVTRNETAVYRESDMEIMEFFERSGGVPEMREGSLEAIGYSGPGYAGGRGYAVDISEFDIDRRLPAGSYMLSVNITYDDYNIAGMVRNMTI